MEDKEKVIIGTLVGGGLLVIGANIWHSIRQGKKDRERLEAWRDREIKITQQARDRVMTRIADPDEPVPSLDDVMNHFKFEIIIGHEEL